MKCSVEMLAGATCRVLEEATFLFAEPVEDPVPAKAELTAQLTLGAPLVGWIRIEAPRAFAASVAANLLGCEPGDAEAEEKAGDALGELLNIVAGVLAGDLLKGQPCRLGAPLIGSARPDLATATQVLLRTEDEHLVFLAVQLQAAG